MTKPLEFTKEARIAIDARGKWCHACGIAGATLERDHVIPRELFASNLSLVKILIAKADPSVNLDDNKAVRDYMVSEKNGQNLCDACHNNKSRTEAWQIKAGCYTTPMRAAANFDKPTYLIPPQVANLREAFKTMASPAKA